MKIAKRGGKVARDARKSYEQEINMAAISNKNSLNYKYLDQVKEITDKNN